MSDNEAKMYFIKAYLDELDAKIERLGAMADAGYKDEALTLCLVYVDGLAQRLSWPSDKSGENFVNCLSSYASDTELGLVHPLRLVRALDAMKSKWQPIKAAVQSAFPGPGYDLLRPSEVSEALAHSLTPFQRRDLEREMWRGTIAAVAYFSMRVPAVHALGASDHSFSSTTNAGQPALSINLPRLQKAAHDLAKEMRRRSEANSEWFGNDEILAGQVPRRQPQHPRAEHGGHR